MPTMTAISRSTQDRILSAIDTTQDVTTKGVARVSSTLADVLPDRLLDAATLPAGVIPTPHEAVELTWGFAEQLVNRQRAFADRLVDAGRLTPSEG